MKDKNIHFIERHVEKLILGGACMFMLVVVWVYVLGQPYTVKVGIDQSVPPSRVNDTVEQAATNLFGMIGDDSASPLDQIPIPQYTQLFRARISQAPLGVDQLDPLGNPGLAEVGQVEFSEPTPVDIAVSVPPAPVGTQTVEGFGVLPNREQLVSILMSMESGLNEEEAGLAADRFADIVSEQAPRDFRYVSVAASFDLGLWREKLKDPANGESIPEAWWRGALLLTGVGLERQDRDPQTGQWSEAKAIEPLVGSLQIPQVRGTWVSNEAESVLKIIREKQSKIATPGFVPMIDPVRWIAPVDVEEVSAASSPGSGGADPLEDNPSSEPVAGVVPIWAHDMTVQPGMEYRYRLKAWVYNPLFQQERVPEKSKQLYYNVLGLESEVGPWSEPVSIAPELQFYIVGGSQKKRLANVEVWRVFNGMPRRQEFTVSPGDTIGSVASFKVEGKDHQVPMQTGVVLVDIVDPHSGLGVDGQVTAVLYMDIETGELHRREIDRDVTSPSRQDLLDSVAMQGNAGQDG